MISPIRTCRPSLSKIERGKPLYPSPTTRNCSSADGFPRPNDFLQFRQDRQFFSFSWGLPSSSNSRNFDESVQLSSSAQVEQQRLAWLVGSDRECARFFRPRAVAGYQRHAVER